MKVRDPRVPTFRRLALSARLPFLGKQADDLGVSFDAIGHSYEGDRVVKHPNQRKAQHFAVKNDGSLQVADTKRHLSNAERFDRIRGRVRH